MKPAPETNLAAQGAESVVAEKWWRQAIAEVRAHYPEDIFPPDSLSVDARSGTFARHLCDMIVELAEGLQSNHERWHGPEQSDG